MSGVIKKGAARARRFPIIEKWKIRCWARLAWTALWVLGTTTRKRYLGLGEDLLAYWLQGKQVIVALWHDRVLLIPFAYYGRKVCIFHSAHRDGEILARVFTHLGVLTVSGSSTRGWFGGLKQLLAAYRQGHDLVVTSDGPRGPRHQAKSGAIQLARATGAPIFPVAYGAVWKTHVRSWDRLLIPFPFSRVVYVVGHPIFVPPDAEATQLEAKRLELEECLRAITAQADAYCRGEFRDSPQAQALPSKRIRVRE